jgi:hypothetical protein
MEYTYCLGIIFYSNDKHYISKNDIYRLCLSLNSKFGEDYKFIPEAITEGGILMNNFPNKNDNSYKTLRIRPGDRNMCDGKWPWINEDFDIFEWKNNYDKIFINKKFINKKSKFLIPTFLKAFHGAPVWKKNELLKICEAFEEIGFKYIKSSFPSKKNLAQIGSLGV